MCWVHFFLNIAVFVNALNIQGKQGSRQGIIILHYNKKLLSADDDNDESFKIRQTIKKKFQIVHISGVFLIVIRELLFQFQVCLQSNQKEVKIILKKEGCAS